MNRSILYKLLQNQLNEIEKKPYDYWAQQQFPITWGEECADGSAQFEIELLETNPEYIQLSISVDDGGLSAFFPPSKSVVIKKS